MSSKALGSGRLTDEDHDRIHELAAKGLKCGQIAQRLGRHQSTVQWYMYSEGLQAPTPAAEGTVLTYKRGDHTVNRFSAEEDAFIETLRIEGVPISEIADRSSQRFGINRKHHSVRCRLIMLAARSVGESAEQIGYDS
jgi:AraC-like DNA-binding protein